mmetsp:Transcript_20121/g.32470  ORF Transcript_20121/g.32470 Transcript_20121/m.32470 type:complete len:267 (-) Transcript_20121:335-1135(-)
MNTQDYQGFSVKDDFHHATLGSNDFPSGCVLVVGTASAVVEVLLLCLLFRDTHHGDLWNSVDTIWEDFGYTFQVTNVKHVGNCDTTLVHTGRSQGREPNGISDGPNMWDVGAVFVVDSDEFASSNFHTCCLAIQLAGISTSTCRKEEHFDVKLLSTLEFDVDRFTGIIGDVHVFDRCVEADLDSFRFHFSNETLSHFSVQESKNGVAVVDQVHFGSHCSKDGRVFRPDHTRTDHTNRCGEGLDLQDSFRIVDTLLIKGNIGRVERI